MKKANRKTIRTYTYYSETKSSDKVAVITIEKTLLESVGHIDIIDRDLAPIDMILIEKYNNNITGALSCLEDRAMHQIECSLQNIVKNMG